jgi:hypothetical protein
LWIIIRYPDDFYDRIWVPESGGTGVISVASEAISYEVDVPEEPPEAVLQNAITTSSLSQSLTYIPDFADKKAAIYMNLYFSEVTDLDTTQKRSFRIYIDNNPKSEPIIPPYGKVTEMLINYTAASNTSFSLVSTLDSTLPPLINAMEVFSVSDPLVVGTNSKDGMH